MQHNYLRHYRKRSQLTQSDIAFIMQLPDYSSLSRWEQGTREPNLRMLIMYRILFDIPIESLFDRPKKESIDIVRQRIRLRLQELRALPPDAKIRGRIAFLNTTLMRLTV